MGVGVAHQRGVTKITAAGLNYLGGFFVLILGPISAFYKIAPASRLGMGANDFQDSRYVVIASICICILRARSYTAVVAQVFVLCCSVQKPCIGLRRL